LSGLGFRTPFSENRNPLSGAPFPPALYPFLLVLVGRLFLGLPLFPQGSSGTEDPLLFPCFGRVIKPSFLLSPLHVPTSLARQRTLPVFDLFENVWPPCSFQRPPRVDKRIPWPRQLEFFQLRGQLSDSSQIFSWFW